MGLWTSSPILRKQLVALAMFSTTYASVGDPTASFSFSTTPTPLSTPSGFENAAATTSASTTSSALPSATDNAPGSQQGNQQPASLVSYYFVFFALIISVAALGGFFVWRRKRKARLLYRSGGGSALSQDLSALEQRRQTRRYLARWRSAEASREEGLNEAGEAPPPYVPKTAEEERLEREGGAGVTMPLQTLSREDAGLKPPDYAEAHAPPLPDAMHRANGLGEGSSHESVDGTGYRSPGDSRTDDR